MTLSAIVFLKPEVTATAIIIIASPSATLTIESFITGKEKLLLSFDNMPCAIKSSMFKLIGFFSKTIYKNPLGLLDL